MPFSKYYGYSSNCCCWRTIIRKIFRSLINCWKWFFTKRSRNCYKDSNYDL